jgi:hypothetical protein
MGEGVASVVCREYRELFRDLVMEKHIYASLS